VTEGPFDVHDGMGRICCYTVVCDEQRAAARDLTHGFR
jgi:hypothetical protein